MTVFGCHTTTTHFTKLPTPIEFKKPLSQLRLEYPDLTRFESRRIIGTIFDMPEAGPLKDAWGEPHRTGFTAWMLLPTTAIFQPSNYWYWEFDGKTISALIGRPMAFSLEPHVDTLKVEEMK
jgi:hypothetical protein